MNPHRRMLCAAILLLVSAVAPGLGQNTGGAKIVPKLEPVAETKLLMEGLAQPNFRGLEKNLSKNPIDDQSWTYARGQALLIAETANLLMIRPPKKQGQPIWFDHAMDLRAEATRLAQTLAKKDVESAKAGVSQVSRSCNRCHQSFRVPIEITPFQALQAPLRKV